MSYLFHENILQIAKQINQKGGQLYLVGGAVRDFLMKVPPHDTDYCVTGLSTIEFSNLFPEARMQGKDFPVFVIEKQEFALARRERKIGHSHTEFEMISDKQITIEEDLIRRDITINAMAIQVLTGELIDPFGGKQDLERKIIRMVSPAFSEDPLRVYRVARFASTLNFTVDSDTIKVMHEMKPELLYLPAERVFAEFRKGLVSTSPSQFFQVLRIADVLDVHFKEISDLIGVEQPILYHPEGDAYTHTLEVLEHVSQQTPLASVNSDEELTRFCALVHDFGKATTPKAEWPRHIGHEERGIELIHNFCTRIKAPNKFEKAGKLTSLLHMKAGNYPALRPSTKVRLFEQIASSRSISFEGFEIVAKADSKNQNLSFAKIANEVMKINATEEMRQKCTLEDGTLHFEKLKEMLFNLRCQYVKRFD